MPAHQLWLKVPRNVVYERGFGVTHKPGDVTDRLTGTAYWIDPLTGFACPKVTWSADDAYTFDLSGAAADWVQGTVPNTTARWDIHTASGDFTATVNEDLPAGHGFFLTWLIYDGAGPTVTVTFGGAFKLVIEEGTVELLRAAATAADEDETLAFDTFWPVDEWYGKVHTLYVYQVGTYVAVRRIGPNAGDAGLLAHDQLADSRDPQYALQPAPVAITSTGHVAVFVSPERHAQTLSYAHVPIHMPEKSTQTPAASFRWIAPHLPAEEADPTEPTIEVLDKNGNALGEDPVQDFTYAVTATLASATGPNLYVTSQRVWFPALSGTDGQTAVDLNAISGVSLQNVSEELSLLPQDAKLSFTIKANAGTFGDWVQENMLGAWKPSGTQRCAFLTDDPQLETAHGIETLTIPSRSRWKSFETQQWSGQESYAGKLLAVAYQDVAKRAGLDVSEITIYTGGYTLPTPSDDDPDQLEFRNSQSLADIMLYLKEQFGQADVLRFGSDGNFYVEALPTASSGVTWYWTTPDAEIPAILAGTSTRPRLYKWQEWKDSTGFANEVWILGADKQGRPLVSFATDWSSINDKTAANYVGEWRRMVVIDGGLTTQAIVNWVCRQVFERVRWHRLMATFTGMYVATLRPGSLIAVDGRGTWRVRTMRSDWNRQYRDGISQYEVEAV